MDILSPLSILTPFGAGDAAGSTGDAALGVRLLIQAMGTFGMPSGSASGSAALAVDRPIMAGAGHRNSQFRELSGSFSQHPIVAGAGSSGTGRGFFDVAFTQFTTSTVTMTRFLVHHYSVTS